MSNKIFFEMTKKCLKSFSNDSTVQSLYKSPHCNMDLDITWVFVSPNLFLPLNVLRNSRTMTIKWSLSYNSFVTLSLYNMIPSRECSGSVVECLTRDRGATGSSLTGITALCL